MHYSQQEKYEIIRLVEGSDVGVIRTLQELRVNKSTFYKWYTAYQNDGYDGLARKQTERTSTWNQLNQADRKKVLKLAMERPELSSRELAWRITDTYCYYISESSVYRILKDAGLISMPAFHVNSASDSFKDKTTRVHEMWQTDFTYFKIIGWGWYYLSTILDDYSRYIIYWELCSTMKVKDVISSVDQALASSMVNLKKAPKLLSDNGSCYIANDLKAYLKTNKIKHVRGRPMHPQTQGKIERYHRSMKNVVKLDCYYSPGQLEEKLKEYVHYYNFERYHEGINNLTPADVYFGKAENRLKKRQQIKINTLKKRKKQYQNNLLYCT